MSDGLTDDSVVEAWIEIEKETIKNHVSVLKGLTSSLGNSWELMDSSLSVHLCLITKSHDEVREDIALHPSDLRVPASTDDKFEPMKFLIRDRVRLWLRPVLCFTVYLRSLYGQNVMTVVVTASTVKLLSYYRPIICYEPRNVLCGNVGLYLIYMESHSSRKLYTIKT